MLSAPNTYYTEFQYGRIKDDNLYAGKYDFFGGWGLTLLTELIKALATNWKMNILVVSIHL